jgi:hypothetical protein
VRAEAPAVEKQGLVEFLDEAGERFQRRCLTIKLRPHLGVNVVEGMPAVE